MKYLFVLILVCWLLMPAWVNIYRVAVTCDMTMEIE
jgi:hypothetical protein